MTKKGSANIILVILVVILLGVVGYLVLGNSNKSPVDQDETTETPGLSKGEALNLVNSAWGTCTGPDSGCTSRNVEIEKRGDVWYVIVISSGLADDSTGASKRVVPVFYESGIWKLGTVESETFRCWEGRGHQDFSIEPCL